MLSQCRDRHTRARPVDAHEHRKKLFRIPVVHLNFMDIRSGPGDVVNNRIGQTFMVRAHGCDGDLHGKLFL